ncbi:MAG: sigma 54-interacting transcriptional regulator [Desulfuromonadaceae bacterium]|nr:sigma 54-interacting transcriptional regulator [Desulfuromonadaceae bacterium]
MGSKAGNNHTATAALRCRAEKQLDGRESDARSSHALHDSQRDLHELQVHQIELEMQNEELHKIREALELSRNLYVELYDYAPVAYFTFDQRGVIQKMNNSGAELLAIDGVMTGLPFSDFIVDAEGRDAFINHLNFVFKQDILLKCSLRLKRSGGTEIDVMLQSVAIAKSNDDRYILTSIVDTSVRKQFEEKLQKAHDNLERTVLERTEELLKTNLQLSQEIEEHKKAKAELLGTYSEIESLKNRLVAENIYLQEEIGSQYNFGEIIGESIPLSQVFLQIEQIAPMNATVLLLGETGTGKGVVARAIHRNSTRNARPLITVNCATLPATLVESELFGRERGAFTGSDARQIGRFELADGGTIFLDEIGEMPLELQSKLLRVIQDGEFERLGSPRTIKVDVRIIAASNRNIHEEVKKGTFREDLFYRLNVFPITIPTLRQRKDDIPLLVNHFVAKFNKKIGKEIKTVTKETLNSLQGYSWPGNVRELESIIERAVIISQGTSLQVLDRFEKLHKEEESAGQEVKALIDLEHDHILQVLQKTGWRIEGARGAAVLLGLNASTLRARMRKYGIVRR